MTPAENRYLQSISQERFYEIALELWVEDGRPLIGGMQSIILEDYNNATIDRIMESAPAEIQGD